MSQLRTGMRCGLGLLVAVGLLGMPGWSAAQPEPGGLTATHGIVSSDGTAHTGSSPAPELRTFGTESTVAHTIQAFEFVPVANTGGYSGDELRGAIACIAFPCVFFAPVLLPAGAVVNSIELEGCDTDAMANMSVAFLRRGPLGPNIPPAQMDTLASASTTGTPGCTRILQALATPETIDNLNNSYVLRVGSPASTPPSPVKNFFYAVRVFYRLQVSPAPAVATFTDVPTSHPFFRFVEALAASGITVGCGGGNFCPDAPLTRGEMAVFLSLGLGLHFSP